MWKPNPLQTSRISIEYLLLPPRSVLKAASIPYHYESSAQPLHLPTLYDLVAIIKAKHRFIITFKRYPFSGPIHSAGELLHTPKRMPTSMATVLLSI